jgi:uncharacterized protein
MPHGWTSRFRRGVRSTGPIPTQIVSNEEFIPWPRSERQTLVEESLRDIGASASKRLGVSRREFLQTSGGMAAALVAMNSVFGTLFDVLGTEIFEASAFAERQGDPFFIFDVQTHYVSAGYDPTDAEARRRGAVTKDALVALRRRARETGLNPRLTADRGTVDDLSWRNFVKEVFLDSETSIGLISTPPGPYPQEAVVPPK